MSTTPAHAAQPPTVPVQLAGKETPNQQLPPGLQGTFYLCVEKEQQQGRDRRGQFREHVPTLRHRDLDKAVATGQRYAADREIYVLECRVVRQIRSQRRFFVSAVV